MKSCSTCRFPGTPLNSRCKTCIIGNQSKGYISNSLCKKCLLEGGCQEYFKTIEECPMLLLTEVKYTIDENLTADNFLEEDQ